ncbi:hypothetical protein CC85DRAFT_175184 [Cutaneotrichosporon oleaginosum]|uniref:Uncharacterized protein n=1 Tax=Cutaneotrichosporon oleaginosum TaxID=879819 RepID=A0A0J0XFP6_9TREE|nr:uncharacterized protein CC85DRAFT_175184 [Cutaneotrichosporon oleaginosum]KLT39887.1 hypothetical protein CC85DRAFT_175184 [Cutaneotrichosporon oleaginosum]TXT14209.1 hypothetical protein COLE_00402 [Cutaneotrichosporon oleaginosum]
MKQDCCSKWQPQHKTGLHAAAVTTSYTTTAQNKSHQALPAVSWSSLQLPVLVFKVLVFKVLVFSHTPSPQPTYFTIDLQRSQTQSTNHPDLRPWHWSAEISSLCHAVGSGKSATSSPSEPASCTPLPAAVWSGMRATTGVSKHRCDSAVPLRVGILSTPCAAMQRM